MKSEESENKSTVKISIYTVLFAITLISLIFSTEIFGENSIFKETVFQNGFLQLIYSYVPAVVSTVQIITVAIIVNLIAKYSLSKLFKTSNRGITVLRLVYSFLRLIIIIVSLLMILSVFGVNTTALVASAGILSLVIGLGAQSLVADILAGIFIVIEGEFQVGDDVILDGWHGEVKEIGIRNTRIEDDSGNIKIVNNSEIKSIINLTQDLSTASSLISIEYSESLQRVELIIKDNLKTIKSNIPEIVDGPFYKGVESLSPSGVDLLFVASCKEEDIDIVQRGMNRELKLLFDKHGISIPFPQIVINKPVETNVDYSDVSEEEARKFFKEQAELSKHLEKDNEE